MTYEELPFRPADILLPQGCDLSLWSVVACDQYTSQPEYWQRVEERVGSAPSSLRLILPPIRDVLAPGGRVVALIKPQFEVGKGKAPGGLVRDEALRIEARDGIVRFATEELGLKLLGLAESPIRGKEMGNVEYLSYWEKTK